MAIGNVLAELFVKIGADTAGLQKGLSGAETQIQSSSEKMRKALLPVGAAFIAIGAAGLKFVSDAKKMNAELGQVALTMGISTKEMRTLALATTDVSFSLDSVTKTFGILASAGIKNTTEMKASALAFDALADATGSSAEAIAEQLIPVFRAFGMDLPKTAGEMDKFTWLTKNTTVSLSDFAMVVQRLAPEMQGAGISMDDAMVALAGLEAKGITGRKATQELGEAIGRAAENGTTLAQELGLTSEIVDEYKTKLEGATGVTTEYADVAAGQYGIMDKLKQKFSEVSLAVGSFMTPLEPMLAAMTALGPAMIFFSTATGTATIKTVAHTAAIIAHGVAMVASKVAMVAATAAQWLLNVAMSANPIGLIILAIAALVVGIIFLIKHFDKVKEVFGKVWDWIVDKIKKVVEFFKKVGEVIKKIFLNMTPVGLIIGHWKEITNFAKNTASKIKGFFQGIGNKIAGFFSGMKDKIGKEFDETTSTIKSVPGKIAGFFSGIKEKLTGHFEEAGKAIVGIMEKMGVDTGAVLDTMKTTFEKKGGGIKGAFCAAFEGAKTAIVGTDGKSGILGAIGINASEILEVMKTTFEEKGGGIKGVFCAAFEGMKVAVGGIINKIFGEGATSTLEGWWNRLSTWFTTLKPSIAWDNLKEGISGAWSSISTKLGDLWSSITGWFSQHKPQFNWEGITTGISGVWNTIKTALDNLWTSISGWFSEHKPTLSWSGIMEGISDIWDDIEEALGNLWDDITDWFEDHIPIFHWFGSGLVPDVSEVWKNIKSAMEDIWDNITDWLDAHVPGWDWTNITSLLTSSINTMIKTLNKALRWINTELITTINYEIIYRLRELTGMEIPYIPLIEEIPYLAKGGIITSPTLALLGEAGPEAVVPLGAGTRGAEVTINLSGNTFLGNEAEARRWARLLTKYIREETRGLYGQSSW